MECEPMEKAEDSEESEDEKCTYIRTRRGVIPVSKVKQDKKPDRLNGEYSYQNTIKQRVIGQPCIDCKMECDHRIAERFRQDNYLNFWGKLKSWEERRTHVRRLVQVLRVPHPKNKMRKKFLRKYYLEMEQGFTLVCKTMFFNTLAISAKFIETTLQKYPENVLDETKIKLVNNPSTIPKSLDNINNSPRLMKKPQKEQTLNAPIKEELPIEGQLLDLQSKSTMRPPCSCPEQCGSKITQESRLKIYDHFWMKLRSWEERKLFIINTIEKDRYTSIRTFVLPIKDGGHIVVCQEMYLNTLSLTEKTIDLLLPKSEPLKPKRKLLPDNTDVRPEIKPEPPKETLTTLNIAKDAAIPPPLKRSRLEFSPLQPPCCCPMQCHIKLTDDIRQQIHREFWNLPAQVDKKHFILSTIQTLMSRDKATKERTYEIKHFSLPFHYNTVVVCKDMYLNTLTVSEEFVSNTIKNVNHDGSIVEDDEQTAGACAPMKAGFQRRDGLEERDFINCADLLESQIKEDVLHSAKAEVRRIKKPRSSKKMGPPCPPSCRHQCSSKFMEEERKTLHDNFWYSMNWQERKQFVMNTVKEFPIKNRSIPGRQTKRNFSRIYTLPLHDRKITVCQKMFFNTLSICSKFVSTVHIWASQVKW
ncbi:hypothetical protein HUJ04_005532 [Dendroctonus ponderosae]|uniref:Uncharacterized protein n=2 Tax=Dendroctonus ponderosae TaxID=77166 RepID=A0AAR5P992_DENPD|nr:hypothetical protein HUJ04_005532 [Dendroctonus ponderosae]